jgi:hypothetical protein
MKQPLEPIMINVVLEFCQETSHEIPYKNHLGF